MRKPRDINAELSQLADRQRQLKSKKIAQLGELVVATGADALDAETLAGVLLDAAERGPKDSVREVWRARGGHFFRGERGHQDESSPSDSGDGSGR